MSLSSIRAPFPWFGGKGAFTIKDAILKSLPPHSRYIEPFGGGASILMRLASIWSSSASRHHANLIHPFQKCEMHPASFLRFRRRKV